MSRALLVLDTDFQRQKAADWVRQAKHGTRVEFKGPKRTLDQNSLMWALLTDVAMHMRRASGLEYSTEEWKHIFLHGWGREVRFLPALDGKSVVPIPQSSSDLSKEEMTDFIEYILKEGAERGVTFHEPSAAPPQEADAGGGDPEPPTDAAAEPVSEEERGAEAGGHEAEDDPAAAPASEALDEVVWLKGFARAIVAAIQVDEEFVVNTSKGMFVDGLSEDTRNRARAITNYARAVCRGETKLSDALEIIAGKARCEQKELAA